MMKSILLLLIPLSLQSCINPRPNSGYFAISEEQAEINRNRTESIEQQGRDVDHVERMRRAKAYEIATRNNPSRVSNTTIISH